MERFSGFIQDGYRFEAIAPTNIYEPRAALLSAYKGRRLAAKAAFALEEMPRWNAAHQCIELSAKDMGTLEQRTKELIKTLEK